MVWLASALTALALSAAVPASDAPEPVQRDAAHIAYIGLAVINGAHDAQAMQQVTSVAEQLVSTVQLSRTGAPLGWRYGAKPGPGCTQPYSFDGFGDGSCNSPDTTYAFQTALAATFLARASIFTGNKSYAELARKVLHHWSSLRMKVSGCPTCAWFPGSDSPNDVGRYIRNTNAGLGMAFAWLYKATQDQGAATVARGVLVSERREISQGNKGYLGIDDPQLQKNPAKERARIEHHYPYLAKSVLDMGRILNDPGAIDIAVAQIHAWEACSDSVCRVAQADRYASCFFRTVDPAEASACSAVRKSVRLTSAYERWAATD